VIVADLLELGAPVVGPHAARYQPSRGRQYRSMCNASDGTVHGDSAPRLSFEQGQAQFAGWSTVSSPLILGEQASERAASHHRALLVAIRTAVKLNTPPLTMLYYPPPPPPRCQALIWRMKRSMIVGGQ
jgi:hypothetical protein